MVRVNIDILGISELKWTEMGKFNSDDHYIYSYYYNIWSPCLFHVYAEHIMRNVGPDEAQVGIKIARRNIINSDMR